MKILVSVISAIFIALGLTACGYDGHYRYPCQDPSNWETSECQPPICTANGACPEDLIGFDPEASGLKIKEDSTDNPTSDIIEETNDAPAPENVDNINEIVDGVSEGN